VRPFLQYPLSIAEISFWRVILVLLIKSYIGIYEILDLENQRRHVVILSRIFLAIIKEIICKLFD